LICGKERIYLGFVMCDCRKGERIVFGGEGGEDGIYGGGDYGDREELQ
jgi:hypothetical protein